VKRPQPQNKPQRANEAELYPATERHYASIGQIEKKLRSKIGSVVTAVAFTLVIGSFGVGSARADNHHGDDRGRGGDQHSDNHNRGHRTCRGLRAQADYYYTPRPNYYAAPEPDYYYGSGPGYDTPPPEGSNLFFGLWYGKPVDGSVLIRN
jgi:hypothetical protein